MVAIALLFAGCSNKKFKTYAVEGKVSFDDGEPVKSGRIEFYQPEQDISARATIREDGSFVIGTETSDDGAVAGEHQVMIMQMIMPGELGMTPQEHGAHIDERYSSFSSSELTYTVEKNNKNFAEFVVKKAKGQK